MESKRNNQIDTEGRTTNEAVGLNQENENQLDDSSKKEGLFKAMLGYQFDYVDRLRKNLIKPIEGENEIKDVNKLGSFLIEKSTLGRYIADSYTARRPRVEYENNKEWACFQEARDGFVNYIVQKINFLNLDDRDGWSLSWKEKTLELIEKEINNLGPIINSEGSKDTRDRVGLMRIDLSMGGTSAFENGLVKSPFEDVINIHLEELHLQKDKDGTIKNIYSGESLSKLAEKIISDYPQVKAVVAKSWIVDSPIGNRIGLKIDRRCRNVLSGIGFWGQFINEKGEIKEDKINKFIETGVPEHYNSSGHIMVEDFLRKYLPKEKRGLIKLKDISPKSLEFRKFLKEAKEKIDKNWNNTSTEGIISALNSNQDMVDYLKTPDGQEYLHTIIKAKKIGLDNIEEDIKKQVTEKWDKYKEEKSNIFIEREVLIN